MHAPPLRPNDLATFPLLCPQLVSPIACFLAFFSTIASDIIGIAIHNLGRRFVGTFKRHFVSKFYRGPSTKIGRRHRKIHSSYVISIKIFFYSKRRILFSIRQDDQLLPVRSLEYILSNLDYDPVMFQLICMTRTDLRVTRLRSYIDRPVSTSRHTNRSMRNAPFVRLVFFFEKDRSIGFRFCSPSIFKSLLCGSK